MASCPCPALNISPKPETSVRNPKPPRREEQLCLQLPPPSGKKHFKKKKNGCTHHVVEVDRAALLQLPLVRPPQPRVSFDRTEVGVPAALGLLLGDPTQRLLGATPDGDRLLVILLLLQQDPHLRAVGVPAARVSRAHNPLEEERHERLPLQLLH
eukprot:1196132-Prorocentrum_minimum.AAC.3